MRYLDSRFLILAVTLTLSASMTQAMVPERLESLADYVARSSPRDASRGTGATASGASSSGPSSLGPHSKGSLPPLNGLEMPRNDHVYAKCLQHMRTNPLLHDRVHEHAALAFSMDAEQTKTKLKRLQRLQEGTTGRKRRLFTPGIVEFHEKYEHLLRLENQHKQEAAALAKPRPVPGTYRGVRLPDMSPRAEHEYNGLKDKFPFEAHNHLVQEARRRGQELEVRAKSTRDLMAGTSDAEALRVLRAHHDALQAKLVGANAIEEGHREALKQLTGMTPGRLPRVYHAAAPR